jgi:hypothetical protein
MTPRRSTALLGLLLLASPAWGFDGPATFHGIPWAMRMEEAETRLAAEGGECAAWQCFLRTRWDRVPVTLSFEFHSGKFQVGHVVFDVRHHEAMEQSLAARYGPPTATDATPQAERSGAGFTIDMLRWDGAKIVIALLRYGPPIDRGIALFMPRAEYHRRYPLGHGIAGGSERR